MTRIAHPGLFGRVAVADPPSKLSCVHVHDEAVELTRLQVVDHSPPCAILDQEDLIKQGIDVHAFIPGAPRGVGALGSCTANTAVEWAASVMTVEQFTTFVVAVLGLVKQKLPTYAQPSMIYGDIRMLEVAAIVFYYECTHATGHPSEEWPPTDCGSSGLAVYDLLHRLGFAASERTASGATSIVSLMQTGALAVGTPYLSAWMDPLASDDYCVDGDGSIATLREQVAEGVAGGHELLFPAIVQLEFLRSGAIDSHHTILEFPNHWDAQWADHGKARIHLSTIVSFGSHADLRQFRIA